MFFRLKPKNITVRLRITQAPLRTAWRKLHVRFSRLRSGPGTKRRTVMWLTWLCHGEAHSIRSRTLAHDISKELYFWGADNQIVTK